MPHRTYQQLAHAAWANHCDCRDGALNERLIIELIDFNMISTFYMAPLGKIHDTLNCIAAMLALAIVTCTLPCLAEPQSAESSGSLRVEVTGLRSSQGSVVFALYDSAERYKNHTRALRTSSQPIINRSCAWQVDGLPHGDYAVMLYHDVNKNGKLDSNLLHVPREPYGFSNNKRGFFGPASFGDTKFSLKETLKVIVIEVN